MENKNLVNESSYPTENDTTAAGQAYIILQGVLKKCFKIIS